MVSKNIGMWLLLLVALLCGCGESFTEVVIVVDGDLRTLRGSELDFDIDSLRIELRDGDRIEESTASFGRGRPGLPRTLGVRHEGGSLGPVEVLVQGSRNGVVVIDQTARFSFVPDESRRLRMELLAECRGVSCDEGQTCRRGGCGAPNDQLEAWTGSTAALHQSDAGL